MILREHETPEGLLVAVCDRGLLGETFSENDVSITVSRDFYGGDEATEEEVVDSLARSSVANIVGSAAVSLAIEHGFVDEANVLDVGSTRHAQVLRLR